MENFPTPTSDTCLRGKGQAAATAAPQTSHRHQRLHRSPQSAMPYSSSGHRRSESIGVAVTSLIVASRSVMDSSLSHHGA